MAHICYRLVIDDVAGNTLACASTLDKEVKTKYANKEAAKEVGALIAKRCKAKKIEDCDPEFLRFARVFC